MANWKFWKKQESTADKEKDRISDVNLARKEALYENFKRDVEKLGKEIIVTLNENIPKNMRFVLASDLCSFNLIGAKNEYYIKIYSLFGDQISKGIKREIYFILEGSGVRIPISKTNQYTQKQLEEAKKQILATALSDIQYKIKNGWL